MAHVKYSARRVSGEAAQNWPYQLYLQPRRNRIPSDDEEAPLWQDLEPSLPEGSSPPVKAVVNFWNGGCPLPAPSPVGPSIGELLKDLDVIDEAAPGEVSCLTSTSPN